MIGLSRNFGKEAALVAGLEHARLGAVLFMDGDGQHPPRSSIRLSRIGSTRAMTWSSPPRRIARTSPICAGCRQRLLFADQLAFAAKNPGRCRRLPPALPARGGGTQALPERNRFFKGLASWIGFRQKRVDYEPAARVHGESSGISASLIGLSIEGLTSFSVAPLRFAGLLGVVIAITALIFGATMVFQALFFGSDVPGYPSLIVGMMVLGGVQLIMIGVLGEYIGKVLSEIKGRPVYFVAEHAITTAKETPAEISDPARNAAE